MNFKKLSLIFFAITLSSCGQTTSMPPTNASENYGEIFYETERSVTIVSHGQTIALPAGTLFTLLETRQDPILGKLARIGIDSDEIEISDLWIENPDELIAASVKEEGATLVDSASFSILKKQTYCYRYVKQYLLKTGQVKTYLPGSAAVQAYKILPKYGFRITGHQPNNALNGEICVYSGGSKGYGHIEVKRNGSWWYGYGYISHPIRGRNFLACFTK